MQNDLELIYARPLVLVHQPISFETSQSWNKGHGPVSGDPGKSDGGNYPLDPYIPKKPKKNDNGITNN